MNLDYKAQFEDEERTVLTFIYNSKTKSYICDELSPLKVDYRLSTSEIEQFLNEMKLTFKVLQGNA